VRIEEWLKEAESRCSGATDGVWYAAGPFNEEECGQRGGQPAAVLTEPDEDGVQHTIAENCDERNADFIAAARTDLPRALRIVRLALAWRHSTEVTCDAAGEALVAALDGEVTT